MLHPNLCCQVRAIRNSQKQCDMLWLSNLPRFIAPNVGAHERNESTPKTPEHNSWVPHTHANAQQLFSMCMYILHTDIKRLYNALQRCPGACQQKQAHDPGVHSSCSCTTNNTSWVAQDTYIGYLHNIQHLSCHCTTYVMQLIAPETLADVAVHLCR